MLKDYRSHPELFGHAEQVQEIAQLIGRHVEGIRMDDLRMASYYHDIGKLTVPESILMKRSKLSSSEMDAMRHHPWHGALIMAKHTKNKDVIDAIHYHHEFFDGSGYPEGLVGYEIPIMARIIAIADVYDALRSDRPYRKKYDQATALDIMRHQFIGKFDPLLFDIFLSQIVPYQPTKSNLHEASSF